MLFKAVFPVLGDEGDCPDPRGGKGGEVSQVQSYYKDKYRREGKGRRCCSGNRIDSIPCCASF